MGCVWPSRVAGVGGLSCGRTGDRLAPRLEPTATALGRGDIGPEHVRVIRTFLAGLPAAVDAATREAAERQLAGLAGYPIGIARCWSWTTATASIPPSWLRYSE